MAITKENKILNIEVKGEYNLIHYAIDEITLDDGVETNRQRFREIVNIGDLDDSNNLVLNNFSTYPDEIQTKISSTYTDEVKEKWKQKLLIDKEL